MSLHVTGANRRLLTLETASSALQEDFGLNYQIIGNHYKKNE